MHTAPSASRRSTRTLLAAALLATTVVAHSATNLVLDPFDYADDAAARAAWVSIDGSPAVQMAESGAWGNERVLKLPCDLSARPYRCGWDRAVSLDLSGYATIELELFVADSVPIGELTLYFRSGGGWYGKNVTIARPGWQTFRFDRFGFWSEGTPAGWGQIDRIRLAPWKEFPSDTYLAARELRAVVPDVMILRDTQSLDPGTVERTTQLLAELLVSWGIHAAAVDGAFVAAGGIAGGSLLILPYNEMVPSAQIAQIEAFVAAGGKLMVFYLLDDRLEDLLRVDRLAWTPGTFASYTLADPAIPYLPPRVEQRSGNIFSVAPRAEGNARVIGYWSDGGGQPTGLPAWIASDHGLYMSHVLLDDDRETKARMLLAFVGRYVPGAWAVASASAFEAIGRVGEYGGYDEAVAGIRARAGGTPRAAEVEAELAAAGAARALAAALRASGSHDAAVFAALDARSHVVEAYARSASPALPELRGVWEIDPTGPFPGDWAAGLGPLVAGGFGAIFPNLLTGGVAHYATTLLPLSPQFAAHGDQLAAILAAARPRGLRVHVWKIDYNLWGAPQSFIDARRAEGRTQVSSAGVPIDWLCPSHPANLALERDTVLEIVERYDVDGIQLDYIRYPGPEYCFCDGCRSRFQADTGHVVAAWPADVLAGGALRTPWLDWRREQITKLVRAVHAGVKAIKPKVVVSAAVWSDYAWSYDGIGQDAAGWIDEGILDAVCPMDYTEEHGLFRRRVAEQVAGAAGRVPVWPGIGATSATSAIGSDGVIAQAVAAREEGAAGFVLFEYAPGVIATTIPALARGTTIPGGAGPVPDGGDVPGAPLRIARRGPVELELSWGAACGSAPGVADYGVYEGSLASLRAGSYDHRPVVCSTGGAISARLSASFDSAYFLVVAGDTSREGSYGVRSAGFPRPASTSRCLPAHPLACP